MTVYHCPAWVPIRLFVSLLAWLVPTETEDEWNEDEFLIPLRGMCDGEEQSLAN